MPGLGTPGLFTNVKSSERPAFDSSVGSSQGNGCTLMLISYEKWIQLSIRMWQDDGVSLARQNVGYAKAVSLAIQLQFQSTVFWERLQAILPAVVAALVS